MKFPSRRCWPFFAAFVAAHLISYARAENWPFWRGPTRDGISTETNLATKWSENENIAWKLPLPGMGGSTPVVWGDRIFLTSEDGEDLVLMCVSTQGKQLWKQKVGSGRKRFMREEGNCASPSPSTDGKHVWTYFGSGDLACFDVDGKEVWKFNVQDDNRYGKFQIQWGMHTTPLLDGDRLYLQLIHSNGAYVIALEKDTGKEIWKAQRQSDGQAECEHSYASIGLWRNGSSAYLVSHGNDYAIAHRMEDGSEIWRLGDLNPKSKYNYTLRFVASPLVTPDLIVVPTAKGGPVVGVKPMATGLIHAGDPQEQWRRPRGTPDVPSPLLHDGLVYLCGEAGKLTCLDAKTGKEYYSELAYKKIHRASPVYADGKVYLIARDATTTVVRVGPKFEVLATNKLPDQMSASPAISNGRIYLRGFKNLYAVGSAN